ncbi:MAG TPA: MarR family transcriptional regulator [Symbiobacteriaceae bacterium]|nr:MarR family transcriptional regulator [Symbiobacteriaceae bacterium]
MTKFRPEIGELWRQVNKGMHDRIRQAFCGTDLPFGILILLREVHHNPGITVSELARRVGLVKSHVSKSIDQLAAQGLVDKRPDPADQRLLRVYPTQAAQNKKKEMETLAEAVWDEVMAEVSDEELDEVARGLQILAKALIRADAKQNKERS